MVDTARQLLDELMGRNRNLDPTTAKSKKTNWDDPEVLITNLVDAMNKQALNCNIYLSILFRFSFVCTIW